VLDGFSFKKLLQRRVGLKPILLESERRGLKISMHSGGLVLKD
jgi:hypothetical protein